MPEPEQGNAGDTSVVTALFHHNTWANLTLLGFCEDLTDEQLDTTAPGGYGSIRDTLLHLVSAEVSYVQRVNGKLPAEPVTKDYFPGFGVLKAAGQWAGDELLQLALAARSDTRVRQRPPRLDIEYRLADLMIQAVTHSAEHRTQVATILTQLGLEPPDMSGWHYMEEMGTLQEFPEPSPL